MMISICLSMHPFILILQSVHEGGKVAEIRFPDNSLENLYLGSQRLKPGIRIMKLSKTIASFTYKLIQGSLNVVKINE